MTIAVSLSTATAAAEEVLVLDGEVEAGGLDHVFVAFEVPPGTVEIEIRHDDLSEDDVLDWGLDDPSGFRGWGGGNDEPAVVGEDAASRSYLAGAIEPGTWRVVIGKASIDGPSASYHLEVVLRDAVDGPTLAPQPERMPYVAPAPLTTGARWYAGDFHVHSRDSGDARPGLDEIAEFARSRGLDFVEISDHNTTSQLDFFVDAQARHPDLLFVPGVEFTTYDGHANGIGATAWVDHRIGQPEVTIEAAAAAFRAQGALFSINHPELDLGSLCIGCAWEHALEPGAIDAVEIATGGWMQSGSIFGDEALAFWTALCVGGRHVAAVGGSDDHRAGVDLGAFQSPIGDPTTMVHARELSVEAILDAVKRGRTVVKLQGPDDPMVELVPSIATETDSIAATAPVVLTARVTGGIGEEVLFVRAGEPQATVVVDADPFEHAVTVDPPAGVEEPWRAEVWVGGAPRTVTSHLFITGVAREVPAEVDDDGCGCRVPGRVPEGRPLACVAAVVLAGLALARRRQSST